jgi:hypothetical protein
MIATRMRDSAFQCVLTSLPLGTPVKLDAPYGDFVLHTTNDSCGVVHGWDRDDAREE